MLCVRDPAAASPNVAGSPRLASPKHLQQEDVLLASGNGASDVVQLSHGVEVTVGTHRLRCLDVLGSGSYSVVWRSEVLHIDESTNSLNATTGESPSSRSSIVALKDVFCRSELALRQTLFEVQLLMAAELQTLEPDTVPQAREDEVHRLPRCLAHSMASHRDGWVVRCVMNILPGEQLDQWLHREARAAASAVAASPPASPGISQPDGGGGSALAAMAPKWTSYLGSGCALAKALVVQLSPTLEKLAAMAWHRDINSHNVLIGEGSSFWLCDLGLAADSKAWPSEGTCEGAMGAWKLTDIGGDCRYWPPSCWMVHCHGTEYLEARPDFCQQYQWRLDIHGLGITGIEVLCSRALAACSHRPGGAVGAEGDGPWGALLAAWKLYWDTVSEWWERIFAVFSQGGDLGPVHAWLTQHQVAEQTIALLADLHRALEACAAVADEGTSRLLLVLRDFTSETSKLKLRDACEALRENPPWEVDEPEAETATDADLVSLGQGVRSCTSNDAVLPWQVVKDLAGQTADLSHLGMVSAKENGHLVE